MEIFSKKESQLFTQNSNNMFAWNFTIEPHKKECTFVDHFPELSQ